MLNPKKSLCYFETPNEVALEFVKHIYSFTKSINHSILNTNEVSILDVFAGDGRLGKELSKLFQNLHHKVSTTFVEIDKSKIELINSSFNSIKISENAFAWHPPKQYDLIITNPPFEKLTSKKSRSLGFDWDEVKIAGRNLYCLSILKCLEFCSDDGLVAVIAPFSWLSGFDSIDFREELLKKCSSINITAFNHRGVFENVIQDVGFQLFIKKNNSSQAECKIFFSYNGIKNKLITKPSLYNTESSKLINVRVGPIVWNRKKNLLTSKKSKSIPLIYGGNIDHDGKLNLKINKYFKKQYILKEGVSDQDKIKHPAILIRRTLRGNPGQWKVDSCLIDQDMNYTAENHVVVVEILSNSFNLRDFHSKLINKIRDYYYFSGSPNISTKIVRNHANHIINNINLDY